MHGRPRTDPAGRALTPRSVGFSPRGALLPALPPHASAGSSRQPSRQNARVASWSLSAADPTAASGWLRCAKGANGLPLPMRLTEDAAGASRKLEQQASAAQQLTLQLTRLMTAGATAREGVGGLCMIAAHAVGAEEAALVATTSLGIDACLTEHNFVRACEATAEAAPACQRLVAALPHELREAAESRAALNIGGGGGGGARPAALEVGQVAIREPPSARGALVKQSLVPLHSALVTPVNDPGTGSTVALLICCNARAGHFSLCDELLCECAAQHAALLWMHHVQVHCGSRLPQPLPLALSLTLAVTLTLPLALNLTLAATPCRGCTPRVQVLRLAPLPTVPLPPPDASASRLAVHWSALADGRARLRELRLEGARALARVGGSAAAPAPYDAVFYACRRLVRARASELRNAMRLAAVELTQPRAATTNAADALRRLGEDWSAALELELRGEATRLAGAAAAAKVVELLSEPLQAVAGQAAKRFAKGFERKPRAAARDGAALEEVAEEAAEPQTALEALERLVVEPSLRTAAPTLRRLPFVASERTRQVRARLAENLVEEATWVAQHDASTAALLGGESPPSLGFWVDGWHAACLSEVLSHALETAGEAATTAAAAAIDDLVGLHEHAMRVGLGAQLQGANLVLVSVLEQQFWRISEWVEKELKGRLAYRERFLEKMRSDVPRWQRQLLSAVVLGATAAHRTFETRAAAAASAGVPQRVEPPDYLLSPLSAVSDLVVGELLDHAAAALDPLGKQFASVISQVKPRERPLMAS